MLSTWTSCCKDSDGSTAARPPVRFQRHRNARVFLATLLFAATGPVAALELQQSSPAAKDTLAEPPRSVRLWFDRLPANQSYSLAIVGEGQRRIIEGVHTMGEQDLMGMATGDMPDGTYQLTWQVGDARGSVPFTIARQNDAVADHWEPPLDIGVVLYDGAEPLDVFGPLEMWMNAGADNIRVHLIAERAGPVVITTTSYPAALAPRLQASYDFSNAPELDVLMVPGGIGTLTEVDNPAMIEFLQRIVPQVAVATSVCTGSALYAKAGLLKGVEATGNKVFFDYLVAQGPADWQKEARWVESGRFLTSSGVSAGIDMSLAVIARFFGVEAARMIASSTEYEWNEDPQRDPFVRYANTGVPFVGRLRRSFAEQMDSIKQEP